MGLIDRLHGGEDKRGKTGESLESYSGMRVEVLTKAGQLMFPARLSVSESGRAQLRARGKRDKLQDRAYEVNLRGYGELQKLAIHMEGVVAPLGRGVWRAERLYIVSKE